MNKNGKTKRKKWIVVCLLLLLILSVGAWSAVKPRGAARVEIAAVEWVEDDDGMPENPAVDSFSPTSEQRVDFTVSSAGRGRLSTFNVSAWTTNGSQISVGEFSLVLRQIEQIGAHDARTENYIDYIIPDDWNSSQRLSETITVKELQKNPVRALIANEPLFHRGVDYPANLPFEEVEIQVDGVNFYTDVNETEYLAWVRLLETEPDWDIKQVVIEGWDS